MGHYVVQISYATFISPEGIVTRLKSKGYEFSTGYGVLIDSGTTFSYFTTGVYNEFYNTFDILCTANTDCHASKTAPEIDEVRCFNLGPNSSVKFASFPTLTI